MYNYILQNEYHIQLSYWPYISVSTVMNWMSCHTVRSACTCMLIAKRIQNVIEFLTYEVFRYTCRGLYETHKFLFTLQLGLKIDMDKGHIKYDEFQVRLPATLTEARGNNPVYGGMADRVLNVSHWVYICMGRDGATDSICIDNDIQVYMYFM